MYCGREIFLNHFVDELQTTAEVYTDKYYAAKEKEAQAKKEHIDAKDELGKFNMVTLEYEKDLKRKRKRNSLSDRDLSIVEIEISDIVEEQTLLQDTVPHTKVEQVEYNKLFLPIKRNHKIERRLGNL